MKMTEKERIELFSEIMNPCIPYRVHWETVGILKDMGYFTAPASSHHHGNYEGGLFDHCFAVTKSLVSFTERLELKWSKPGSPLIVGMFHDLCKVDDYQIIDGRWEYKPIVTLPGHGEKSVMMVQQLIDITDEELHCIRWHMGAYDAKENWDRLGAAIQKYPNVLYTHTADMVAARILGV